MTAWKPIVEIPQDGKEYLIYDSYNDLVHKCQYIIGEDKFKISLVDNEVIVDRDWIERLYSDFMEITGVVI
jgi:hypothetical protein